MPSPPKWPGSKPIALELEAVNEKTQIVAANLSKIIAWIEEHDAGEAIAGIYPLNNPPRVNIDRLDSLQRLFAGKTATKKRDSHYFHYTLIDYGIEFSVMHWPPTEAVNREPEQVTL